MMIIKMAMIDWGTR